MQQINSRFILPSLTLCQREVVRFLRQKSRVIGAIVPPALFWFLIGTGLGSSFRHSPNPASAHNVAPFSEMSYLQYFFPGTVAMIVMFTAIFSTISIIEDRNEGFLQSVLTAPVSRSSIVMGKILGGTVLSFLEGLVFILLAPFMGATLHWTYLLYTLAILFLVSFGQTGLGFLIAWQSESTQGFHSVMNIFLMPMWFLSGAVFPLEGSPRWLRWTMTFDPLTYGVSGIRQGLYPETISRTSAFLSPVFCLIVTSFFCVATFILSIIVCERRKVR